MNFVLKHVFSNVSKMKADDVQKSDEVSHAGVKWSLSMQKLNSTNYAFIFSVHNDTDKDDDWFVDASLKFQLLSSGVIRYEDTYPTCFKNSCLSISKEFYESTVKSYLVDDQIVFKYHVNINKVSGIPMEKSKIFDESTKELADVVLTVGDEKFHVSKPTLAIFSSYFKSLFLGGFEETGKKIIELKNIDPAHFQVYLEAIYGKPVLCDSNVERTLELAEMYDSPVVTRSCEVHLMSSSSKIPIREKIRLSSRFKLDNLLQTHLDSSKNVQEIKSLFPVDMDELDPNSAKLILQRLLKFV